MPCSKRMRTCRIDCGHREIVTTYREERERLEIAFEDQTERERDEWPLPTFKQWLLQRAGKRS